MTNPRKPFRLNVGFIINATAGYNREFDFYLPTLKDEDGAALTEVQGTVKISRTPQGLLVEGKFGGQTRLTCVRCLEDYEHALRWDFTELYAFSLDNVTDSGLLVPDDAQLDLEELVRDGALLEIPISPICKPDCQGLCIECGQNLNLADCGHSEAPEEVE
ncbi:MAG: hypothetical protein Fur0035_00420 [Anaerolineales bacterium]